MAGRSRHGKAQDVMELRYVQLVAKDPERNILRHWQIEPILDLFGRWTIRVTFGRIGRNGRSVHKTFGSEAEARRYYCAALRRRATAPRRIGVNYQPVDSR